jgi:hypothetical protein
MSISAKRNVKHGRRVRVGGAAQHGALRRMLMSRAAVLGAWVGYGGRLVQRLQVRGIVHGEKRARYGYTVGELESMESEAGACLSLSYLVVYPLWYKNRCQVVGKHDNVDSHRNCHFQLIHQTCCFPTTTGSSLQLSVSPAFLLLPVADTSLIATLLSLSGFLQPSPKQYTIHGTGATTNTIVARKNNVQPTSSRSYIFFESRGARLLSIDLNSVLAAVPEAECTG